MGEVDDPLCCCEYINSKGERSHLLALFCDCAEVDDMVDRLVKGLPVPNSRNEEIMAAIEDRYRVMKSFCICAFCIYEISSSTKKGT